MHTEKDTACPFCHTEYDKTEEKTKDLPAMPVHAEQTEKKGSTKTRKESFKIWKDV